MQNNVDGTVTRVDPATNRAVATIAVDSGPVMAGTWPWVVGTSGLG